MPRLNFCVRLLGVALAFPAIIAYIAVASIWHRIRSPRNGTRTLRVALRLWMSVCDWIKGIPIGYSYWVQYEAPVMLDEIAVHHDE